MRIEKAIQNFVKRVEEKKLLVEGIAVADEKQVIIEHRFTRDIARNIYSHTKSYTASAVGMAVDEGKLSLNDRLVDYFSELVPENASPWLSQIQLKHLLTMSSGFGQAYLMGNDRRNVEDYLGYMMGREMMTEPGAKFVYSNGDTYLAGRMMEKAVGEPMDYYLHKRLFAPLKIYWAWEHDEQGHAFGASGLYLTLTDMLKLGQLHLADGVWNGERILSHSWIAQSGTKQIETGIHGSIDGDFGYGYQMWMCPMPGTYRADGAYGQLSIILPDCGLLVAIQCPETDGPDFEKVKPVLYHELLPVVMEA